MFVLKPYLYFRCPESGKEIPIRLLDEKDSKDAALIRKIRTKQETEQQF